MSESPSDPSERTDPFKSGPRFVSDLELEIVDEALAAAIDRDMYALAAYLAIEQAMALQWRYEFRLALARSEIALDAWRAHLNTQEVPDSVLKGDVLRELQITGLCATQHFRLGNYEECLSCLLAADRLVMSVPPCLETAQIAWTRSLLEQWRNQLELSLEYAQQALQVYTDLGLLVENARLRVHAASVALDCAIASFYSAKETKAHEHIETARRLLDFEGLSQSLPFSEAAELWYRLAYAKYSRLSGRNEDRAGLVESIGRRAAGVYPATLGEVYATLGDEFASQPGRDQEARTCYRRAIDILDKSHTPAFAAQPRRRLALLEEMSI